MVEQLRHRWTFVFYVIFVGLNIVGIEATMRFTVIINILALAILLFFFIAAIFSGDLDFSLLNNIPPEEGGSSFLPFGIGGIFPAIPFAIWFFLAIEELPLAAEESHDPARDIPRATIWGMTTLVLTGALVLFLNTGLVGGDAAGRFRDAVVRRVQGRLRRWHQRRAARAVRHGRADRELLHDHLRVRQEHVLALACGLLPEVALDHALDSEDAHVALIAGAVVGYLLAC